MKTESEGSVQREPRTCPVCGTKFFATADSEFCPVCVLRGATGGESATTGEPGSVSGLAAASAAETDGGSQARRFDQYEVMLDEAGRPIELGRGAMGVTYKAFDVDLRYPVTLKVISERGACRRQRAPSECCVGLPPGQNRERLLLCDGVRGGRDS